MPVVVFLRRGEALRLGGVRHDYLTLQYLSCELGALSSRACRDSTNLVARLNLPNMAHEPSERVEVYGLDRPEGWPPVIGGVGTARVGGEPSGRIAMG